LTFRFLVDMPVMPKVVEWLAAAGHDAVHASAVGLARASDEEILERALAEGRIVVTADLDYPRLLALRPGGGAGLINPEPHQRSESASSVSSQIRCWRATRSVRAARSARVS
jgi:hypothetical protein